MCTGYILEALIKLMKSEKNGIFQTLNGKEVSVIIRIELVSSMTTANNTLLAPYTFVSSRIDS